ncbi:MAG: metallophosphoesterase [Candidatus Melainabacteria bacterium]|nr:metallophosphoesterase [Candidatus Melainabacteria bacterium]
MSIDPKTKIASLLALTLLGCNSPVNAADKPEPTSLFFAKPYLQLGNHPHAATKEAEDLLWLSKEKKNWAVDIKPHDGKVWKQTAKPITHHALADSLQPNLEIYSCELTGLTPGALFDYRVRTDKEEVFRATGMARKTAKQPLHIVIFGDCASGSKSQRKVAFECNKSHPDLIVVPGDIVYQYGLFSEYASKFFPVYNADEASPTVGAPLTRSHLFVPVIGNHDIAYVNGSHSTDLNRHPDALAYFTLWSQPRNGPITKVGAKCAPPLIGSEENQNAFLKTAGSNFPVMANYSFDYGNTHWTCLDANNYMDWTDSALRNWVKKDIAGAKNARWKFVTFHQPGFSDGVEHSLEQRMRLLSDIFEECGVDVVWAGHVHNYQRSYPLFFKAAQRNGKPTINPDGTVSGTFKLDTDYNGTTVTKPKGVIYVVTGAGGAQLYSVKQQTDKTEFICKFNGDVHSYTVCDINGDTMDVRQVTEDGAPLDEFKLTKK